MQRKAGCNSANAAVPGQRRDGHSISNKMSSSKKQLSSKQREDLLKTLQTRFEKNMARHRGLEWSKVKARLEKAKPEKLWSLDKMEETGGEPDVVGQDKKSGEFIFW